jgi:hypothetical protein
MNTKLQYFDVTGVTRAETLVTRTIKASSPLVAKRKMRRKIKGIRSLQTHLSPSQEAQ